MLTISVQIPTPTKAKNPRGGNKAMSAIGKATHPSQVGSKVPASTAQPKQMSRIAMPVAARPLVTS
jgi:hypothetical protein